MILNYKKRHRFVRTTPPHPQLRGSVTLTGERESIFLSLSDEKVLIGHVHRLTYKRLYGDKVFKTKHILASEISPPPLSLLKTLLGGAKRTMEIMNKTHFTSPKTTIIVQQFTLLLLLLLLSFFPVFAQSQTFDYEEALSKSLLYFEAQRSGRLPYSQRVPWRDHSGLTDGLEQGVSSHFRTLTHSLGASIVNLYA